MQHLETSLAVARNLKVLILQVELSSLKTVTVLRCAIGMDWKLRDLSHGAWLRELDRMHRCRWLHSISTFPKRLINFNIL
jgi:hypothetical protein